MDELKRSIMNSIYNGMPFEEWIRSKRGINACKRYWNEVLNNMNTDAGQSGGEGYGEQLSESKLKKLLMIK